MRTVRADDPREVIRPFMTVAGVFYATGFLSFIAWALHTGAL
ncbi:MAG: hypothetical protein U1E50_05950 [Caulobacteraceae bacterium]